jgi:hypothetical protein
MRSYLSSALLFLLLLAVISDIVVRSRPVHAQGSPTVYVNAFSTIAAQLKPFKTQGSEVIGFSCSGDHTCYVLSK